MDNNQFVDPAEQQSLAHRMVSNAQEMVAIGADRINDIATRKTSNLPIYLPGMEEEFVPLEPGTVCIMTAPSHQGKTLNARYWYTEASKHLREDEIILVADFETYKDQEAIKLMRQIDKSVPTEGDMIKFATAGKPYLPDDSVIQNVFHNVLPGLVVISPKMEDAAFLRDMTLPNISKWAKQIQSGEMFGKPKKIIGFFFDYLGVIPKDIPGLKKVGVRPENKTQAIEHMINEIFILAGELKSAVVVLAQTPKKLEKNLSILSMSLYDVADSSDVGRRAHVVIGLTMPSLYLKDNSNAEFYSDGIRWRIPVRKGLQMVEVVKHRISGAHEITGKTFCYQWSDDGPQLVYPTEVDENETKLTKGIPGF